MNGLERIPESLHDSVKYLMNRLKITSDSAYDLIRLEALLWDLPINDPGIVGMILKNAGCENVRV